MVHWLSRRLIAGLLAAATLAGAQTGAARDFRAADTQGEDYPTVRALLLMDRLVRERTAGRHRIQVFHSRQLGEERETIEQTRVGAVDLNRINIAPLGDFVPEANVLALPFLFRSADHLHAVLDGPIGEEILASFSDHGLVGLAFYDAGARSIYSSVRPIEAIDDLRGLRIRVQHSDLMRDTIQAFGATPVALAYGQVMTGLATGLLEGAENNWPSYVTAGHHQAAPYYSLTEHSRSPEVLVMSQKAWNELSPEDQAVFRQAARESSALVREKWREWEAQARRHAETAGVIVSSELDRAGFIAAAAPVYRKYIADPRLRELVERIRAIP